MLHTGDKFNIMLHLKTKYSLILILCILVFIITCKEAILKTKNIENNNPIKNAIRIQINGETKDSVYPLNISLYLFTELPKLNDQPEFNNSNYKFVGSFKNNQIVLEVNKGIYFGLIEINNNKYYPMLYSNLAKIHIKFGSYYETIGLANHRLVRFSEVKCIWKNLSFENREIICPPMLIDNKHQLNLVLNIEENAKFSESKTVAIWLGAVYGSLYTLSPAGLTLPILLGPIAVERKIESNLVE